MTPQTRNKVTNAYRAVLLVVSAFISTLQVVITNKQEDVKYEILKLQIDVNNQVKEFNEFKEEHKQSDKEISQDIARLKEGYAYMRAQTKNLIRSTTD